VGVATKTSEIASAKSHLAPCMSGTRLLNNGKAAGPDGRPGKILIADICLHVIPVDIAEAYMGGGKTVPIEKQRCGA